MTIRNLSSILPIHFLIVVAFTLINSLAHASPLLDTLKVLARRAEGLTADPISNSNSGPTATAIKAGDGTSDKKDVHGDIIPGIDNSVTIILLVTAGCLAMVLPMFAYMWLRRKNLRRAREGQSKVQLVKETDCEDTDSIWRVKRPR
jgi:hypothetical protein